MKKTDFRALCSELVEELAAETSLYPDNELEVVTRARAALASNDIVSYEFIISDWDYCIVSRGMAPSMFQAIDEGRQHLEEFLQFYYPHSQYTLEVRRIETVFTTMEKIND